MNNSIYNISKFSFVAALLFLAVPAFSQHLGDNEIKKNVAPVTASLQKVLQLEPKTFEFETSKYKHLKLQQGRKYGFLAENVQGVFPELVKERSVSHMFGKNSYRDATFNVVDEASLIPLLVASIKEQQEQIEKLKAAVEELKNKKTVAVN
jgi:hypothetical protein